ncbi:hypothetical protein P799_11690 [Lysinibacillus sphaericus CBAM5]|uniref:Uncharacterized protein n=1 Tax=Lysinibacillus sphaericus CBAM5 TaxID=1400869 RepID=W7S1I3_LYSSH|nr:hypothetical protein P799_11690 [Lysinibacillus sphaericus CBAM5]
MQNQVNDIRADHRMNGTIPADDKVTHLNIANE